MVLFTAIILQGFFTNSASRVVSFGNVAFGTDIVDVALSKSGSGSIIHDLLTIDGIRRNIVDVPLPRISFDVPSKSPLGFDIRLLKFFHVAVCKIVCFFIIKILRD